MAVIEPPILPCLSFLHAGRGYGAVRVWETLGAASPHFKCCRTDRFGPYWGLARCTSLWRRDAAGLAQQGTHGSSSPLLFSALPSFPFSSHCRHQITSTHSPQPGCGSLGRDFSQELGRSRRWLPRLPQLVAALRSHTPACTVPNSQLIHQLESPGGFPGSRLPGRGIQVQEGDRSSPRTNREAAFPAVPQRSDVRWEHSTSFALAARQTRSRSPAGLGAGWVTRADTTVPQLSPLCHRLCCPSLNPAAGQPGAAARRLPMHSEGDKR